MSVDLGRRVAKLNYSDPFTAYTGITITSPDSEDKFTAGKDSGRTLEVEIPWASQNMADNLLAQFRGVQHQPFTATGAILDPAAELGDAVTVDGVTGIMYRRNQRFGSLYRADISAPGDEEINHEIPYYPPIQRAVNRIGAVARSAAAAASKAQGDILQDRKELIAALNREDGAPKDLLAGFDGYVRWDLANNEGFASSQLFAQIGEKARAEIGVYAVEANGEVKTLAQILADQVSVMSKVNDTEAGLDTKVSGKDLSETLKNYALATALSDYLTTTAAAEQYVTSNGVTSIIGNYIVEDAGGNKKSLAAILADVIRLQGRVDLTGSLSVSDGVVNVSSNLFVGGSITSYENYIGVGGNYYEPKPITSTSGAVFALGIA